MNNIEVIFSTTKTEDCSDIIIALLSKNGFNSFEKEACFVKAYIDSAAFDLLNMEDVSNELLSLNLINEYKVCEIENKNWNKIWESNFSPIQITKDCYVRANFHEEKSNIKYEIIINPKMAFGTGHHETTSMVIEFMLEIEFENKTVLDVGCGSGILSILAEMRNATNIIAIDNDENSWKNTIENSEINICTKIKSLCGDIGTLEDNSHDIILANINRNVLLENMSLISKQNKENGILILSGFYKSDVEVLLQEAQGCGYALEEEKVQNNWTALKLIKQN